MNGFIRRQWPSARLMVVGCLIVILPPSFLCSGLKCGEVRSLGKNGIAIGLFSREPMTVVTAGAHHRMKFDLELKDMANVTEKIKIKAQFVMYQHQMSVSLWGSSVTTLSDNSSKCVCLKPAEDRRFVIVMKQKQDNDTSEDIIIRSNDEITLKSETDMKEKIYFFNLINLDEVKLNVSFCGKETNQESSRSPSEVLPDSSNCSLNEMYSLMQREGTSANSVFCKSYKIIYVNFGLGLTLLVALICALCKYKRNFRRERQDGVSPPPPDPRFKASRESVRSHIYEDPYQFLNTVTSNIV
ncbi:uncharacterized protein [Macrobrachium rosenbergii]|uniref:uncharacterized protein n=1 Tax=Macrobrachium rosenbergii TaxID=79674 RepID=UPI0034D66AC8